MTRRTARILALSIIVGTWPALAAADIYLTVPGAPGDVTDAGHTGTIRAFSLDWVTGAETSWTKGGGASVGKPNLGPLRLTLATGPWSNSMLQAIASGRTLDASGPIVIDVAANGRPLYRMTFQGFFLTKFEAQVDAQKGPNDAIDAVFKSVSIERFAIDERGATHSISNVTWDIPSGVVGPAAQPPAQPPALQQAPAVAPQLKQRTN